MTYGELVEELENLTSQVYKDCDFEREVDWEDAGELYKLIDKIDPNRWGDQKGE